MIILRSSSSPETKSPFGPDRCCFTRAELLISGRILEATIKLLNERMEMSALLRVMVEGVILCRKVHNHKLIKLIHLSDKCRWVIKSTLRFEVVFDRYPSNDVTGAIIHCEAVVYEYNTAKQCQTMK